MTPTELMKEEHERITLILRILEKICTKNEAKEKVDIDLDRILEFFKIFIDQGHHGKEENLPYLSKYFLTKYGGCAYA
jgi:hemerythrin-like domain-containing protein